MLADIGIKVLFLLSDGGSANRSVIRAQKVVEHVVDCRGSKGCGCHHDLELSTGQGVFYMR
jgi:hypothetical protein